VIVLRLSSSDFIFFPDPKYLLRTHSSIQCHRPFISNSSPKRSLRGLPLTVLVFPFLNSSERLSAKVDWVTDLTSNSLSTTRTPEKVGRWESPNPRELDLSSQQLSNIQ
jgi:hypothetical protein